MKNLIFICLLAMVLTQQVQHTNRCNDCGQLKSQTDCESEVTVTGSCEWVAAQGTTAAKCQKKTTVDPLTSFKPFCELIDKPETNCAKTLGCAYLDSKCTHFAGCPAYVKTTNVNTNPLCANYFTNCVTTGAGCVAQTTCKLTVKQQSCEGTPNCSWQPICTSDESCSEFKENQFVKQIQLKSALLIKMMITEIHYTKFIPTKCGWVGSSCVNLVCSSLTGAYYNNDANCTAELSTCISNRVDACITKYDCGKLFGTQSTCMSYPGYCTNTSAATDTTACILRKCTDNTDATDNATCAAFLPGCISNGKGCVDYTTTCTSMKGTQETCNKIFAFKSGSSADNFTTNQCYNTSAATATDSCQVKTCKLATGQADGACPSFLEGCVNNGSGGCVDPKAGDTSCASYTGVAAFCESAIVQTNTAKYCFGTSTSAACTTRACTDNSTATTDEACQEFMTGCIAKSEGCCISKSSRTCAQQSGTIATCSNFSGGLSGNKVGCTKYDACQTRACGDKTNPTQASDCTDYKSTCRFKKSGSPCIDAGACNSYSVPDTAITDQYKFDYCTTIKDNTGLLCGHTKGASACSARTCDQFLSTYTNTTPTCVTYLQKNVSTTTDNVCKLARTYCYLQKDDCTYAFPTPNTFTDAQKLSYCQKFLNSSGLYCSFKTGDTTCTQQDTYEKVVAQTSAQACNDILGYEKGIFQKVTNTLCLTTTASCGSYTLDSTLTDKKTVCESLKVITNVNNFGFDKETYTGCTWTSGNTCSALTCSDIASVVSQKDCDSKVPGCYYYAGKCYAPVAKNGCPGSFASNLNLDTDTKKAIYCKSLFETEADTFCEIKKDASGCQTGANADCVLTLATAYTPANFNGVAKTTDAFCVTQSTKDKTKFCVKDDAAKCKAGTCEDIPSPASQGDCDLHLQ